MWLGVWALTRALMVIRVGFWNHTVDIQWEDVGAYEIWSDHLATQHSMPPEDTWQYPPGAAFVMLIPRLIGGGYHTSFVITMLLFDLLGFGLIALLANRERRDAGVWAWLLAVPLLGVLPLLRFDLVPTVIGIAALVVIQRRPYWFGALAGLGAMVKVWPVVALLGEWDRRRLFHAVIGSAAAIALVFAIAAVAFGDQSGFLASQNARGLQIESVASLPWHLRELINGHAPHLVERFGTTEIGTSLADAVANALEWVALGVLVGAAVWWWARDRAIRRGRTDLTDPAVSRDYVFTVVLLLVVTSRVLSPQFMIWLIGLSAVILTAGTKRLARPAWVVIAAVALSTGIYQSPGNTLVRNLALLVAAVDAAIAMAAIVRREPEERESSSPSAPQPASGSG